MKVYLLIFERVYLTGYHSGLYVENLVEAEPGDIYVQEDINRIYHVMDKYQEQGRQVNCRLILRQAIDPETMLIVNQPSPNKPVDTPAATTEIDYSKEGWD